jgi:hypothetical protein
MNTNPLLEQPARPNSLEMQILTRFAFWAILVAAMVI